MLLSYNAAHIHVAVHYTIPPHDRPTSSLVRFGPAPTFVANHRQATYPATLHLEVSYKSAPVDRGTFSVPFDTRLHVQIDFKLLHYRHVRNNYKLYRRPPFQRLLASKQVIATTLSTVFIGLCPQRHRTTITSHSHRAAYLAKKT